MGGCCHSTNPKQNAQNGAQRPLPNESRQALVDAAGGTTDKDVRSSATNADDAGSNTEGNAPGTALIENARKLKRNKDGKMESSELLLNTDREKDHATVSTRNGRADKQNQKRAAEPKKRTYDLTPRVQRSYKIYQVSGKQPVSTPFSGAQDWQQALQIYAKMLNMTSYATNLGQSLTSSSIRRQKQQEIFGQLETAQMHREIELMVKILELRNRNWVQEQIRMSRKLANMRQSSFESLVITREFLQLREHFNWFVWAVSYYYFSMTRINQFFQYYQLKQIQQKKGDAAVPGGQQRAKAQSALFHEINHLLAQVNALRNKLPNHISRKWTDGFTYQGVHFRMLPLTDSRFVKNEMKALKYLQNELMELSQIQATQLQELPDLWKQQNSTSQRSIYKNLILPLLGAVECGGFFLYASPVIYIQGYTEDEDRAGQTAEQRAQSVNVEALFSRNDKSQSALIPDNKMDSRVAHGRNRTQSMVQLKQLYGQGIYRNASGIDAIKPAGSQEKSSGKHGLGIEFLQENVGEINDPLLQKMPLLKKVTKENIIPIIDFEDRSVTELNFLLIHGFSCMPQVYYWDDVAANGGQPMRNSESSSSTIMLDLPTDISRSVLVQDHRELKAITADGLRRHLDLKARAYLGPGQIQRETDIDDMEADEKLGGSRVDSSKRKIVSKLFTKHGFDLVMISYDSVGHLSEVQQDAQKPQSTLGVATATGGKFEVHESIADEKESALSNRAKRDSILLNKRAQQIFQAREDESQFLGLHKEMVTQGLRDLMKEVNGQDPGDSNQQLFISSVAQQLASREAQERGSQVHASGMPSMQPHWRKQSILRRIQATGQGITSSGFFGGLNAGPGLTLSSLYPPDGAKEEYTAHNKDIGGSKEPEARGNAVLIAQNSATEFKLKYALIGHQHDDPLELVFVQSIQKIVKTLEDTDSVFSAQALKELMHRKGLNLRFQWILLAKIRSQPHRELLMIHILVRCMKKIIAEETKLKALIMVQSTRPKIQMSAPKTIAAADAASSRNSKALSGANASNVRPAAPTLDQFDGANNENFRDSLVFFCNQLLRRKFSKQKHVFDETLLALFLSRLKVLPMARAMINTSKTLNLSAKPLHEAEIIYLESRQVLEDVISAPSQNPALFMSTVQAYFNVDIEPEFLRKCRQDKYLFLSKLTSQPMTIQNVPAAGLSQHIYYSLREFAYFTLANQLVVGEKDTIREQLMKLSIMQEQAAVKDKSGNEPNAQHSILMANQSLRDQIFKRGGHARGGNTTYADSFLGGEIMNDSSATEGNRQFIPGLNPNQPTNLQLVNSSILSRSSALNSQFQAVQESSKTEARRKTPAAVNGRGTPRQFKNIDSVIEEEKRGEETNLVTAQSMLQRQAPLIEGFNTDEAEVPGAPKAWYPSPELVLPPILYKLSTQHALTLSRGGGKHMQFLEATALQGSPGHLQALLAMETEQRQHDSPLLNSNFLAYYNMPKRHHVFDTWVMYLESILKEVIAVEGSEQIILEALNFLALTIYFGEPASESNDLMMQFRPFSDGSGQGIGSPLSDRSMGLATGGRGDASSRAQAMQMSRNKRVADDSMVAQSYDRDQFLKVCGKIKEYQAVISKCAPETLITSQIIDGLSFEELQHDDSVFPIEAERSYLSALLGLFQIIGDPRGRGNSSTPLMLLVTWKLSLLSLSIENRKVHDAEFAEELFDACLNNLTNHKALFRRHQNYKLNRVIVQQEKLDRRKVLTDMSKAESMAGNGQGRRGGDANGNFNSRRSHRERKDGMYRVTQFEQEMDLEAKMKGRFDIRKFHMGISRNSLPSFQLSHLGGHLNEALLKNHSLASGSIFGMLSPPNQLSVPQSVINEVQNTPRNALKMLNGAYLSNVAASDASKAQGQRSGVNDPTNIHEEGIQAFAKSQTYQEAGFMGFGMSSAAGATQARFAGQAPANFKQIQSSAVEPSSRTGLAPGAGQGLHSGNSPASLRPVSNPPSQLIRGSDDDYSQQIMGARLRGAKGGNGLSSAASIAGPGYQPTQANQKQQVAELGTRKRPGMADHRNSLLEANISDIEIEFDDEEDYTEKEQLNKKRGLKNPTSALGPSPSLDAQAQQLVAFLQQQQAAEDELHLDAIIQATALPENDFARINFSEDYVSVPEVPFVHWSIYKQSIENVVEQQGQRFRKQAKQMNKFLCSLYRNVLFTAIDKKILRPWILKYNSAMHQSGLIWRNSQVKQALLFHTAQMVTSSRSSTKSSRRDDNEFLLGLSVQGSIISQAAAGAPPSFRSSTKSQHLGSYSSIINSENGSINKGDVQGVLYSWGSDGSGQLGHDSFAHLTQKPVKQKVLYPRMITALKDEFIREVCCGYGHTLAITMHGNVYAWGTNESCQLGLGPKAPEFVRKPRLIQNLRNIVKLSAGNEHSAALDKNHEIYTWGSMFQTGQNDMKDRDTPQAMAFFKRTRIAQVACGGLHTLALTKEHQVFCWGSTEGGQLGLPMALLMTLCNNEENAVKSPQLLESLLPKEVIQIACGETHSLALCKDGKIFGWGTSMYGQLGLGFCQDSFEPGQGMQRSKVPEPREIEALADEQIAKIFCGATFSLFLTISGELYGCGMNDVGQLGEDVYNDISALENAKIGQMQTSDITVPTQVSSLQGRKIQTVACGEAHVLAIDAGEIAEQRSLLFAWGQYKYGQLGLGEVSSKANPRLVQNLASSAIHKIACGSSHSLALVGDASNVTTLSPNFYAGSEMLANSWQTSGLQ